MVQKYSRIFSRWLALAFLFLFPLSTVFIYTKRFIGGYKWEYGTLMYYGIELIGWALIITTLIQLVTRSKKTVFSLSIDRLFIGSVLLFILYSYASSLWAIVPDIAVQQSQRILLFTLLACIIPQLLQKKELLFAIALGSIMPICIGLYQSMAQSLPSAVLLGLRSGYVYEGGVSIVQNSVGRWVRAYGTFAHSNMFGAYLSIIITSMLISLDEWKNTWQKIFLYTLLFLASMTLALTFSRSAFLMLIFGIVYSSVIIWQKKIFKKEYAVALVCSAIGMAVVSLATFPFVQTRIGINSAHEGNSISERAMLISTAKQSFFNSPIIGVGAGNSTAVQIKNQPDLPGYSYQPVHNIGLLLLVEYGIIGYILLCVISITCWFWIREWFGKSSALYIIGGLAIFIPGIAFDHYLITSVHGMGIIVIWIAVLSIMFPQYSSERKIKAIDG